jgi:hypothetical protein
MTSHAASATAAFPIPQATASTTARNSATSNSPSNHVAVRRRAGFFLNVSCKHCRERSIDERPTLIPSAVSSFRKSQIVRSGRAETSERTVCSCSDQADGALSTERRLLAAQIRQL